MSNGNKKGPYSPIQWTLLSSVGSLAPSVHKILCNPIGPGQFCALPSECLALWHQQMNVSVHHTSYVVDMLGAQVTTSQHLSCHCWRPCTVSACFMVLHILHTPSPTGSGFSLVQHTSHTQKSKHNSYFKVCHSSRRPSIFNLTYSWYPLIAVQWHNLHVPITCLNLQSHNNVSCQTHCYLIFLTL